MDTTLKLLKYSIVSNGVRKVLDRLLTANVLIAFSIYFLGVASPGPSNMAIMGMAMSGSRTSALMLAMGVICGSVFWGMLAAFGLSAILASYSGLLVTIKIIGGIYLFWLAVKSARSALTKHGHVEVTQSLVQSSNLKVFFGGAAIHMTNPKAVFVWMSIVSFAMPVNAPVSAALLVVLGCCLIGIVVFCSYALLFSTAIARRVYMKLRRYFESCLALFFGFASYKMLTSKIIES